MFHFICTHDTHESSRTRSYRILLKTWDDSFSKLNLLHFIRMIRLMLGYSICFTFHTPFFTQQIDGNTFFYLIWREWERWYLFVIDYFEVQSLHKYHHCFVFRICYVENIIQSFNFSEIKKKSLRFDIHIKVLSSLTWKKLSRPSTYLKKMCTMNNNLQLVTSFCLKI